VSVDFTSREITVIRQNSKKDDGLIPGMEIKQLCFTKGDALEDEIKSFVKSVVNRKVPQVTGQMGRDALKIALNIMEQIENSVHRLSDTKE
jgi:hypothetical protein